MINLDNYEQYLLMYVDNELSAAERMQVEEFLRDYPYLQQELDILQQTVLPLENMLFDKSSLLKPLLDEATQEKLLMHLDGELPAGESLALQNSLNNDTMLQKEWNLLQKTKLDAAETIEHPGKESLYRRERTRVIPFIRWAAAAMLVGAGLYVGVNMLRQDEPGQTGVAVNDPSVTNVKGNPTGTVNNNNTASVNTGNSGEAQDAANDQENATTPVTKDDQPVSNNTLAVTTQNNKKDKVNDIIAPKNRTVANPDVAVNNQKNGDKIYDAEPKELPQANNGSVLKANEIAMVEKVKTSNEIDLPTNLNTSSKPTVDKLLTDNGNAYARTASLGFEEKNQDQVLMMEEENVSRSKAAVFLKKLKRNVERRTNIKPGKSLRIAGFEFAVK